MAKSKQLVCLDEICNDILKEESNKSEYIRKAIIFFDNSEKQKSMTDEVFSSLPKITELN